MTLAHDWKIKAKIKFKSYCVSEIYLFENEIIFNFKEIILKNKENLNLNEQNLYYCF
jgi:hypothetical protein